MVRETEPTLRGGSRIRALLRAAHRRPTPGRARPWTSRVEYVPDEAAVRRGLELLIDRPDPPPGE